MSSGSINGVPVRDHRAAVLAQQASTVLAMAAEDHPARDSLRRAASEWLDEQYASTDRPAPPTDYR